MGGPDHDQFTAELRNITGEDRVVMDDDRIGIHLFNTVNVINARDPGAIGWVDDGVIRKDHIIAGNWRTIRPFHIGP